MKKLLLLFFAFLTHSVGGGEVSFRVADADDPKKEARVLLMAFDAFSEVVRATADSEVIIGAAEPTITVRYSHQMSEEEMAEALLTAFIAEEQKQLMSEIEALKGRLAAVRSELEREASPTRRMLLQRVYASLLPALDGKRQPFPLLRLKKEPIQPSETTRGK